MKVKLTKFVSVNLPAIPNFIVHEDGKIRNDVGIELFSDHELKLIGRAWTAQLLKEAAKKRKIK